MMTLKTLAEKVRDLPSPLKEKPANGTRYFVPWLDASAQGVWTTWTGDEADLANFAKGWCFESEADAQAFAETFEKFIALGGAA